MNRLVVVSNRLPPSGNRAAAGGVAVALQAALRERGGLWFGWNGETGDGDQPPRISRAAAGHTLAAVNLEAQEVADFYEGFANRALWPLLHYFIDLVVFERRQADCYRQVNARFALQLHGLLEDGDVVWVHDYQLIPLGEALRALGWRGRTGFFLHVPFPATEVLLTLPNHRDIGRGLLGYDLVGFQTRSDRLAFHDYAMVELGATVDAEGTVRLGERATRTAIFPIGIDADHYRAMAKSREAGRSFERVTRNVGGRKMIVGVDRLDYTKGLVERLRAYSLFLATNPAWRGKVAMTQIAPPSRGNVPEYRTIRRDLDRLAGHVNGRFAELDWMPFRYINRAYSQAALAGVFRATHVALVTPLRDGMNLIAKEYVAAQSEDDPGVLVLSRFAGAARQMREALIVNPYDTEAVAEALRRAVEMPREERRERWQALWDGVRRDDVHAWHRAFIDALEAVPGAGTDRVAAPAVPA